MRMRGASVFAAVLACAVVLLFASNSTPALGTPQSGYIDTNCAVAAAREPCPQSSSSSRRAEEASHFGKTSFPTHENLQLTLKSDCANVEILTDASNEVTYNLWLDPKIGGRDADVLRRNFSLTPHNTPRGLVLIAPAVTESDCRVAVSYVIHMPRRYELNIAAQSGDIVTQDIDGHVSVTTGGGNIEVGNVGTPGGDAGAPGRTTFTVRLETAGGAISVGDVAGGLRATTAGGRP